MLIQNMRKEQCVLALVCFLAFFMNNHVLFPDIMETRNLVTAYEMVHDGNWLLPTMNGEWRLEKPPLPTWFAALVEMAAPDQIAIQRGVAGVFAILLVVFFYKSARLIHPDKRYAFLSTLVLCTCQSVAMIGRTVSWDIYCHAFMMGAIYHLIKMFRTQTYSRKNTCLVGLYIGLSFLSKGPVSFYALLLPFLMAYGFIYHPSFKFKIKTLGTILVIGILMGTWWYAYLYLYQGEILQNIIRKETSSWINHNIRPWYYYWNFFLESGIWSLLLLSSLLIGGVDKKVQKSKEYLFPLVWLLIMIVLLSLLPEKKKRYLFPTMIPASYLMGYLLLLWENRFGLLEVSRIDKILFRLNVWGLAGIAVVFPFVIYHWIYGPGYISFYTWGIVSSIAIGCAFCMSFASTKLRPNLFIGCVIVLFGMVCILLPSIKYLVNNSDRKSISALCHIEALNSLPFYYNIKDDLRIELVYAAKRKIRPLDVEHIDSVSKVLPCILITHDRVHEELPSLLWEKADSIYVGCYDDNSWPLGSRRYSKSFIYHVTVLVEK